MATSKYPVQYFSLSDSRPSPFGLLRATGPVVERYIPNRAAWVESAESHDYLNGDEFGARRIDQAAANALIVGGHLVELDDAAVSLITAWPPSD